MMQTPEPVLAMLWNYAAVPLLMPGTSVIGEALAVNDSVEIVGWVSDVTSFTKLPVRWDKAGNPAFLDAMGATYGGEAHDINNYNVTVGALYGYATPAGAFGILWQGANAYKLHPLSGDTESAGLGINDRGTVVGYSAGASGRRAVVWGGPGSSKSIHPGGVWTESQAEDINERGDIAGWVRNAHGLTHAFLWPHKGTPVDLGATPIRFAFGSQAFGINNSVDVAGTNNSRFAIRPTVWLGSGTSMSFPLGNGTAMSISDRNRTVGTYDNGGFQVAFTGTSSSTFEDLPGAPPNFSNQAAANDVNTCGTTVGWLHRFNVGRRPVKWSKALCDPF